MSEFIFIDVMDTEKYPPNSLKEAITKKLNVPYKVILAGTESPGEESRCTWYISDKEEYVIEPNFTYDKFIRLSDDAKHEGSFAESPQVAVTGIHQLSRLLAIEASHAKTASTPTVEEEKETTSSAESVAEAGEKDIPNVTMEPISEEEMYEFEGGFYGREEKDDDITPENYEPIDNDEGESDFFGYRSQRIKQKAFLRHHRDDHKIIGVWSPFRRIGVTTFVMNMAIHMAKQRFSVCAIEGISENHIMKTMLKRMGDMPEHWESYASVLHAKGGEEHIQWNYKNVFWLPLDYKDKYLKWNEDSLYHYLHNLRHFEFAFYDFPNGELKDHSNYHLAYIDELWIMVDDSYSQLQAWKSYIQNLHSVMKGKVHLLFNPTLPFSRTEEIRKELGVETMTELPELFIEAKRNNYETFPLWQHKEVRKKMKVPLQEIHEKLNIPVKNKRNFKDSLLSVLKGEASHGIF